MRIARIVLLRLPRLVAVVLIVSFMTFTLTKLMPGGPVEGLLGAQASNEELVAAVEKDLHLDEPFFEQYVSFVWGAAQGDLGRSYINRFETTELLGQKLPASLELMLLAQLLSIAISIPLALYTAYRANSRADRAITTATFGMISVPNYALAVGIVWLFALQLGWFPAVGYTSISEGGLVENLKSIAQPLFVLSTGLTAVYTRLLRSDLIATLQEDFVLMARSKGLPTWHILLRHALRPSSFSLLTVFALNFGTLIGGSVIVERFFSIPGIGSMAVEAISTRDYLVVQGIVLLIATAFVVINFAVDLLYSVLDPRIRRTGAA